MGAVNMFDITAFYNWLKSLIMDAIRPVLVWPQKIEFALGGEMSSEHHGMPVQPPKKGLTHLG
jgi:hypothetical protein